MELIYGKLLQEPTIWSIVTCVQFSLLQTSSLRIPRFCSRLHGVLVKYRHGQTR